MSMTSIVEKGEVGVADKTVAIFVAAPTLLFLWCQLIENTVLREANQKVGLVFLTVRWNSSLLISLTSCIGAAFRSPFSSSLGVYSVGTPAQSISFLFKLCHNIQ